MNEQPDRLAPLRGRGAYIMQRAASAPPHASVWDVVDATGERIAMGDGEYGRKLCEAIASAVNRALSHDAAMADAAQALAREELAHETDLRAGQRLLAERDAEIHRLREREQHFARMLRVPDGGQYRADWTGPLESLMRERDTLQRRVRALEEAGDLLAEILVDRGSVTHDEASSIHRAMAAWEQVTEQAADGGEEASDRGWRGSNPRASMTEEA